MGSGDALDVNQRLPIALTIAGSDSGGGAGIQADLKTFAAFGVYGASVVTALTAQNTRGVRSVHYPPPSIVSAQIDAVLEDFAVGAIKIGMLGSAEIAGVVAERLSTELARERRAGADSAEPFLVYDPVMIASSGDPLSGSGFVEAVRHALLPLVDCLTPNLAEAAALLSEPIARGEEDMARQGGCAAEAWPPRGFDEGRSPRRRRGGGPSGDRGHEFVASLRRDLPPKTCMAQAARSRAPSPPTSFSALPCRRLWRRPRRS